MAACADRHHSIHGPLPKYRVQFRLLAPLTTSLPLPTLSLLLIPTLPNFHVTQNIHHHRYLLRFNPIIRYLD